MAILTNPIAWSTKQDALFDWSFGAANKTVRWADQTATRPAYPYILLDITSMAKEGGIDEVTFSTDLTRARDVKVTPIAQNTTTYTVTINGTDFAFVSDASATIAEITAGLKVVIDAGSEPVSTTDNSTDLDIVGDFETLNPATPQLFTIVVTDDFDGEQISRANNDTGNEVEVRVTANRVFTLNVQAFERDAQDDFPASDPTRNAYNTLTLLQSSLGLPSVQSQLRTADIAIVEPLPIIDLSALTEDTTLSSASMDVRMRTLSVLLEYQGFIEDVSGESTYEGSADSPITDTYSVTST